MMSSVVPSILFQTDRQKRAAGRRAPVAPPERLNSRPTVIAAVLAFDALAIAIKLDSRGPALFKQIR